MIALPPPPQRRHPTREHWRATRRSRLRVTLDVLRAAHVEQWFGLAVVVAGLIIVARVAIVVLP